MKKSSLWLRAGLFTAATLAVALLGAWLLFGRGPIPIETDLLAMLPATEQNPLAETAVQRLAHANGDRMVLLVENADDDRAKAAARVMSKQLAADPVFSMVLGELPPFDMQQFVAPYLSHRFSLLSDADRQALAQPNFDLAQNLTRHLNEPFAASVGTSLQDDPFGWLQHWLDEQPWSRSELMPEDNLLSDADRQALAQPNFDLAQNLTRHLNEPFAASVGTSLQDDPFGWLQHWLDEQPWSRSELMPEDNLLSAHRDGHNYVMITATLAGSSYDDDIQRRALAALAGAEKTITHDYPGTSVLRTGAIFYAASARAGAEHDVHLVGWVSSIGIALLMLLAFRSLGPLLFAFLSTVVGVIAATTVTLLVFGKIYLLTLVFGAALLGEAVDYSIQYLTARANAGTKWEPRAGLRQVRVALLLALATSLLGYALLGLVPFPALQQMACFAMSGMLAACVSVFWLLPALLQRPARPLSASFVRVSLAMQTAIARLGSGRRGLWLALLLLVIAAPGWWQLRHDDDVHLLIAPPPALDAQELEIRSVTGLGNGSQFFLVQGDSIEQTLEREEALEQRLQKLVSDGQMHGWIGLAGMVPSQQRQNANLALLAPWMNDPARMRKLLTDGGFRSDAIDAWLAAWPGKPIELTSWLKQPLATPFRHLWMGRNAHGYASLVLPQGQDDVAPLQAAAKDLPGVQLVDKPASVSTLFGLYRGYASLWLLAALLLLVPVFAWRYGIRQAARVMAPPALGIALTLSALGYLGQPLTLFHWMAMMLVLGVGANYAVFLHEGEPHVKHNPGAMYASVLLSAVTALLSFGLLSLSSMPALRSFGLTLLLGIAFIAVLVPASVRVGGEPSR